MKVASEASIESQKLNYHRSELATYLVKQKKAHRKNSKIKS